MEVASMWTRLSGIVAPEVVQLSPYVSANITLPHGLDAIVAYLQAEVAGTVWIDHVALIAPVLALHRYTPRTILITLTSLHTGFVRWYGAAGHESMAEWDANYYFRATYVDEAQKLYRFPAQFWQKYAFGTAHVCRWFAQLDKDQRQVYRQFILPLIDKYAVNNLLVKKCLDSTDEVGR